MTTYISHKILEELNLLHILGQFFSLGRPLALGAVSMDLPYTPRGLVVSLGLGINSFFDGFVLIVKITISFVQLGSYQWMETISEVSNEYVLV